MFATSSAAAVETLGRPQKPDLEREVPGGQYITPPHLNLPPDAAPPVALDVSGRCSGFLVETVPSARTCGDAARTVRGDPVFVTANHCEPVDGVHIVRGPAAALRLDGFQRNICSDSMAARVPRASAQGLGSGILRLAESFPANGARVYLLGFIGGPVRLPCRVLGVTLTEGVGPESATLYRHLVCDPPYMALNGFSGGPVVDEAGDLVGFNSNQLIMQGDRNNRMGVMPLTAEHLTCDGRMFLAPRGRQTYRDLVKDWGRVVRGEVAITFGDNGCALAGSREFRPLVPAP